MQEKAALQDVLKRKGPGGGSGGGSAFQLPAPDAEQTAAQQPWNVGGSEQAWAAAQQWQPSGQQQQQAPPG